jgi:anti-sigma-K factor RskA
VSAGPDVLGGGVPHGEPAPGYALGALDAEEHAAFAAHLAGCAECRAEVRGYQETVAMLAHAAPITAAPPALRARILAEARASAGGGAGPDVRAAAERTPRLVVADGGRAGAPATRAGRAATPRATRAPWLAAAASLALAAGLGAGWARERGRRADAVEVAAQSLARGAAARLAAEQDAVRAALASRDSLAGLIAALTEPDVRVARLAATGEAAAMRLTWNRRRGVVVVTAAALPAPPAGRTYQLWGITRGGAPQSLGTFRPDADGSVRAVLRVPPAAAMELAAVTEEAAGGAPRPTSAPLMTGAIGAE